MFLQRVIERFAITSQNKALLYDAIATANFNTCPGSLSWHHKEKGGLKKHTEEVTEYGLLLATKYEGSMDIILTAAILHDISKVEEYITEGADYRNKIGHVVGSFQYWLKESEAYFIEPRTCREVGHCILAHHGRYEWGSPKIPQTIEAIILHAADMKSAQGANAEEIVEAWLLSEQETDL